jgi:hypothetical protein
VWTVECTTSGSLPTLKEAPASASVCISGSTKPDRSAWWLPISIPSGHLSQRFGIGITACLEQHCGHVGDIDR